MKTIRRAGTAWLLAVALAACGGGANGGEDPGIVLDPGAGDPGATADDGPGELPGDRDAGEAEIVDAAVPDAAADPGAGDPGPTDPGPVDPGTLDPGTVDAGPGDPGPADVPATDDGPAADHGDVQAAAWPFVQCTTDDVCKQALGQAGYCNRDFPGGQCQGCDPFDFGTEKCNQLAHDGETLTCVDEGVRLCLFDCPCPSWLRCVEAKGVCALKPCTDDQDCAPFQCRLLTSTKYCLPWQ